MFQLLYLGSDADHVVNAHTLTEVAHEGKQGEPVPAGTAPNASASEVTTASDRLIKFQPAADAVRPYAYVTAEEARELLADPSGLYQLPVGVTLPEADEPKPAKKAKTKE